MLSIDKPYLNRYGLLMDYIWIIYGLYMDYYKIESESDMEHTYRKRQSNKTEFSKNGVSIYSESGIVYCCPITVLQF